MKNLQKFIIGFLQNKGHHVFLSLLIAKICGFLGSLIIIKILPPNEFGVVSIVASIFALFMPFSGFGSHHSLLRFGSLTNDFLEKRNLSNFLLKKGFAYQILVSSAFLLCSFLFVTKYIDIIYIFLFFTIRLIGFYFLNHIQVHHRMLGNNKKFARLSNIVNIAGFVLLLLLSYFFGLWGYLAATCVTPFFALIWLKKEYFSSNLRIRYDKKSIWDYAIHTSFSGFLSDALFSLDIIILSILMNEGFVASYKVAILIPSNITILAATFMQSDYPVLAKNYLDKNFLTFYIQNYYKIFIPLSFAIFIICYLFRVDILTFFFNSNYSSNTNVFTILLGGFCLNILLRNLYGTVLSAVGLMKFNTLISILNLLLLSIFSLVFVDRWGIIGMALSMTLSTVICGLLLMFIFLTYLKNLK